MDFFKKSEATLRAEAIETAIVRYNIIKDKDTFFITYNGHKISTAKDTKDTLIDRLQEYREMFVKDYISKNGRI